ncbi:MAG TPA: (deoxy)nucleoside triphosphate pyrophosphohydrolase [Jatrophihabitans sp.]|nr:(deoxy)nucleoside triphosphate pyrophosphohydrolase [Jatrophihabitans sp.]
MRTHVVGAAIVRDGRVLAARRAGPADLAGRWEFPGGKVEPDESEAAALMRECREELGVAVQVGERLGEAADPRIRLVLYVAYLETDEPRPHDDHDAIRWLPKSELEDVDWLPIDRVLLPVVAALL